MSKKGILIIVGILVLAGAVFYKGYLYRPVRDIGAETAALTVSSSELAADYEKDATAADAKYLNKTIEVTGAVTQAADSLITVDSLVVCSFDKLPPNKARGNVAIKGRCIGYDEIFGEVKLDQCTIKE
ncbi:OB-fold putative lipoprotein [Flavobacterium sp. MFBS3-15]|uniref:OB-fold putative lipoprotein n=1 Tax=Flavobacterium sp. MFBS3-15 TaxID=2989816 RepID=UPI0022360EEF|nr:OB-fold putative lipoprotein [Flavobacterium sp. MFBS3-15]MCW4469770.1 OB-fold putative lipoprotein [Flavobacterium sp. MFBS3-15]